MKEFTAQRYELGTFSSISDALIFIGNLFEPEWSVEEGEHFHTFAKDEYLIRVESYGTHSDLDLKRTLEENFCDRPLGKLMKSYMSWGYQVLLAKAGFAPRLKWVKSFQVLIKDSSEREPQQITVIASKFEEASKDETVQPHDFVEFVFNLVSFMLENRINGLDMDIKEIGLINEKLKLLNFQDLRPGTDLSYDIASIIFHLLHKKQYHLASELCIKFVDQRFPFVKRVGDIIQDIAWKRKKDFSVETTFSNLASVLQDFFEGERYKHSKFDCIHYFNPILIKQLVSKFLKGTYTWRPAHMTFPATWNPAISAAIRKNQMIRVDSSSSDRYPFASIDDVFEAVPEVFGTGPVIESEELPRTFAFNSTILEATISFESDVIHSITQRRYHKLLEEKNLAPKLYWMRGIPIVIENQDQRPAELIISVRQKVDLSLEEFAEQKVFDDELDQKVIDWGRKKFIDIFVKQIPKLIASIADNNLMHGNLHFGNILRDKQQLKVVDFDVTRSYADPGSDCCNLLFSEEETIRDVNANIFDIDSIYQQFCVNMLPILERHNSWALDGFRQCAFGQWNSSRFHEWIVAQSQVFQMHMHDDPIVHDFELQLGVQAPGNSGRNTEQEVVKLLMGAWFLKPSSKGIKDQIEFYELEKKRLEKRLEKRIRMSENKRAKRMVKKSLQLSSIEASSLSESSPHTWSELL